MNPDMVDLRVVTIESSPQDIADWPITRSITGLAMRPSSSKPLDGLAFEFNEPLPEAWKYMIPNPEKPGDNWQYTIWAAAIVDGRAVGAGFIQMWQGRPNSGAPILTDFHTNWAYSARWGALNQYFPKAGDTMAFFVSAGNARDQKDVTSVRERSNVVVVQLPVGDIGVFAFPTSAPPPVDPPPPPTPVPVPTPTPSTFEATVLTKLDALALQADANTDRILARINEVGTGLKLAATDLLTLVQSFKK